MWNTTILLEESRRSLQDELRLGVRFVAVLIREIGVFTSFIPKFIAYIAHIVWIPTRLQHIEDLIFRK